MDIMRTISAAVLFGNAAGSIISEDTDPLKMGPEFNVINLDRSSIVHNADAPTLSFSALGKEFNLGLSSVIDKLLAPNAHILDHRTLEKKSDLREHDVLQNCDFYQGTDTQDDSVVFAISKCTGRGFKGVIASKDGLFELNPLVDDRHIIKRLTADDMKAWRDDDMIDDALDAHDQQEEEHHDAKPVESPKLSRRIRRLNGLIEIENTMCDDDWSEVQSKDKAVDDCGMIEVLAMLGPERKKYFKDERKNLETMLHDINTAAVMFKATKWRRETVPQGVTVPRKELCFDLVIGGVIMMDSWTDGYLGGDEQDSGKEHRADGGIRCDQLEQSRWTEEGKQSGSGSEMCMREVREWVREHASMSSHKFDAIHIMVDLDFGGIGGTAWTAQTCSAEPAMRISISTMGGPNRAKRRLGLEYARIIAHELGHLMGANHDMGKTRYTEGKCGADNLGFIMGYADIPDMTALRFSECSIWTIFQQFDLGNLDCLWENHYQCPKVIHVLPALGNLCGNGQRDFLEQCDSTEECCTSQCVWNPDCCPEGTTMECVEILNDGDYEDRYTGSYDGYYRGCVKAGEPTTYIQNYRGFQSLYLKQVSEINVRRPPKCGFNVDTSDFGDQWTSSWIISRDQFGDINANSLCAAHGGNSIPDGCVWRSVGCDQKNEPDLNLYDSAIDGFSVRILVDTAKCTVPFKSTDCEQSLDWSKVPETITISGCKYGEINGVYVNKDHSCWDMLPDFVSAVKSDYDTSFTHLHYNLMDVEWMISYQNEMSLGFAECRDPGSDLFKCVAGEWGVNKPHDDTVEFVLDAQCEVHGAEGQSVNNWFLDGIQPTLEPTAAPTFAPDSIEALAGIFAAGSSRPDASQETAISFKEGTTGYCSEGYATMGGRLSVFGECLNLNEGSYYQLGCGADGDELGIEFFSDSECSTSVSDVSKTAVCYDGCDLTVHCPPGSVPGDEYQCQYIEADIWSVDVITADACKGDAPADAVSMIIPIDHCQSAWNDPVAADLLPEIPALLNGNQENQVFWKMETTDCVEFIAAIYDNAQCDGEPMYEKLSAVDNMAIPSFDEKNTEVCFKSVACNADYTPPQVGGILGSLMNMSTAVLVPMMIGSLCAVCVLAFLVFHFCCGDDDEDRYSRVENDELIAGNHELIDDGSYGDDYESPWE